jgi:hypothetical protein
MSELLPLPRWLTVIIFLAHIVLFLWLKATTKKRKLTFPDFMTALAEASLSTSFLVLGINFCYLWSIGQLHFPPGIIEPFDPILWLSMLALIFWFWLVYRGVKALSKVSSRRPSAQRENQLERGGGDAS